MHIWSRLLRMKSNEWGRYVQYVIGDDNQTTAAARVGVAQPTIGRWLEGNVPDRANVAALAQAYGRSELEAFIAAGMLTADQVGRSLNKASRELLASLFAGEELEDPPVERNGRRRA